MYDGLFILSFVLFILAVMIDATSGSFPRAASSITLLVIVILLIVRSSVKEKQRKQRADEIITNMHIAERKRKEEREWLIEREIPRVREKHPNLGEVTIRHMATCNVDKRLAEKQNKTQQ